MQWRRWLAVSRESRATVEPIWTPVFPERKTSWVCTNDQRDIKIRWILILILTISYSCYRQNSKNAMGLDSFLVQWETSKTRTINTAVANDSRDMYLSCCVVRCHQSHVADLVPIQIWDSENRNRGVQARRLRLLPHHFTCTHTSHRGSQSDWVCVVCLFLTFGIAPYQNNRTSRSTH